MLLFFLSTRENVQSTSIQYLAGGCSRGKGFEAVADEIARSKADFVTLSEVRNYHHTRFCDRIVEALKQRGEIYYSFYSEDSGLLSRYPIAIV